MYACNYGYIIFVFILKGYNDYVAKKMKRPRLSAEGLKIHIEVTYFPSNIFHCQCLNRLEKQQKDYLMHFISIKSTLMIIVSL